MTGETDSGRERRWRGEVNIQKRFPSRFHCWMLGRDNGTDLCWKGTELGFYEPVKGGEAEINT